MDIDDNLPLRRDDPLANLVKQDIDALSVAELEARIAALRAEIARCEGKVLELIRFLTSRASDNADEADAIMHWLLCWLAYPLQHMGAKMDTAVLFHSTMEGSGKSLLFADIMGELYGRYGATVGQTQLEGNFNAWQSGKLWAVFEEVVSRDQRYNQVGKIKHLITESVGRVEHGTALVDKAGQTMTEVVASIRNVTHIMGEISAASSEQSAGVTQVGEAVTLMDQATQQNAALVEEMAAAASSLRGQADDLVNAVAVFRIHGSGSALLLK